LKRELAAIALSLLAVFLVGALADPTVSATARCGDAGGLTGPVGGCLRSWLRFALGVPTSFLIPLLPAMYALRLFGRLGGSDRSWAVFIAGLLLVVPVGIALALGAKQDITPASGLWGGLAAYYLHSVVGTAGGWIVITLAACALTAATLAWNPIRIVIGRRSEESASIPALGAAPAKEAKAAGRKRVVPSEPSPEEMPALDPSLLDEPLVALEAADIPRRRRRTKSAEADDRAEKVAAEIEASNVASDAPGEELPHTELLTPAAPRVGDSGKRDLDAMGVKLMDALRTFRVEGELVGRTTGPVVTQFEVAPAAGVKVRQIANLSNDLALAMRAPSIRIVAPIPGKGAVGVEVPNPTSEIVAFRELVESAEFQKPRALPIALGKDLEGRPVIADLAKMPHLLIAGATGSGKSVCVNTLITSLVYRHTPRTLRLLMVDPKMVELSVYNTLPHLRHKVVTDNRDAAAVLKWAVLEMQERYELLAANSARNIQDFNRKVQDGASLQLPKRPNVAFEDLTYRAGILPYIVVVIDELADLMMTVQGEVETPLAMLAQKARAIGIHLILATQRPSVNVITGLIKANFSSRIAFRVASQVDSRTILDGIGAESLLGNGDMLFIPPGKSEPSRLQGAFISSEDTERLMDWYSGRRAARSAELAAHGLVVEPVAGSEPDILEQVRQRELAESGAGEMDSADSEDRDKLFREAAEVVVQHQQGSTSLLQRRLKVGYGRAARIIDQLHAAGVLGPPDGSKPRDVLVGLEDVERLCAR
jgi:S-DNA-T family DNA segregation ATPase FtsK/SpoIIIE